MSSEKFKYTVPMSIKKVIIVGAGGQDGQILSKKLKELDVQVFKIFSPSSRRDKTKNIDISNHKQVSDLVKSFKPDEIYYFAAYHCSSEENIEDNLTFSYEQSYNVHFKYYLFFLIAIKKYSLKTKIFYAASSLVFSGKNGKYQNECTPFDPVEIYGLTKAQGIQLTNYFREVHSVFASAGILYTHESKYRKESFLSAKIIKTAMRIAAGSNEKLIIGNLDNQVDWSYAPDFIDAFQLILSAEKADNFIVASGQAHTVREFIEKVFCFFKINFEKNVIEDKSLLHRHSLTKIGDITKIKTKLNWQNSRDFDNLIKNLIIDFKYE